MGAAHDRLPWGPAIVCREYLKEASRCMIQVAGYVSFNGPLVILSSTAGESFADVGHCIIGASVWPESEGALTEVGFPYGFEDHAKGFLYYPIPYAGDPKGS